MTDLTQKLESSLSFARELNSLKEQNKRLATTLGNAREWIQHDFECKKHVLQWDENQKRGELRHGDECTCELEERLAQIDLALANKVPA